MSRNVRSCVSTIAALALYPVALAAIIGGVVLWFNTGEPIFALLGALGMVPFLALDRTPR
jgi:hypothetical protein